MTNKEIMKHNLGALIRLLVILILILIGIAIFVGIVALAVYTIVSFGEHSIKSWSAAIGVIAVGVIILSEYIRIANKW